MPKGPGGAEEEEEEEDKEGPHVSTPDSNLAGSGAGGAEAEAGGPAAAAALEKQAEAVRRRVLRRYGGTGALLALTTAIAMRPPRVVFPVADTQVLLGRDVGCHVVLASASRREEGFHCQVCILWNFSI